jgi:hypothetical protein
MHGIFFSYDRIFARLLNVFLVAEKIIISQARKKEVQKHPFLGCRKTNVLFAFVRLELFCEEIKCE